ncbi:MAG TPA: DUF4856 domain-containing protein [Adhaeribacter sp.]|nr:DUF4856 domain-containing protein [Adhaeribacter sp.]
MISQSYLFRKSALFLTLAATVSLTSCDNDDDENITPDSPAYEVPATYNFANVNYSGQTQRIAMLTAITDYVKAGNIKGTQLDAQKLRDMYANQGNPFTNVGSISNASELNSSGKQLKDKTYADHRAIFETYFDSVSVASSKNATATNGKAGVLASTTEPSKTWLVNANGIEYGQLIAKRMMGAVFYFQAMEGYLTENKIGNGVDNVTVKPGDGTPMEHHFDEAFGYFGAPKDFPTNLNGLKYWADYSNKVNKAYPSNKTMMDAFLKGRAAISNKDMAGKDAAVATIRTEWERVVAASAIYELKAAKPFMGANRDQAKVSHYLSEAIGFVYALQYNATRKISDAQMNSVLNKIGTNLYTTTEADVDAAMNELVSIYGMNDIKDRL